MNPGSNLEAFRHWEEDGELYAAWTPRMLRAAYNYQWSAKDPGAFAHDGTKMLKSLYDRLNDMGY